MNNLKKYGLFLVLILISTQTFAKAKRWVMMCHGGGKMYIKLYDQKNMVLIFKRGKVGANRRKPKPGECSWLDRGMRKNEPNQASYISRKKLFWYLVIRSNKYEPSARNKKHKGVYLFNSLRKRKIFYIHVKGKWFRKGKAKYYKIIRVGP